MSDSAKFKTSFKAVVRSNDQMTMLLLPHLPKGNLVMSSFSLGTAMAMLLAGARDKTQEQILRLFGPIEEMEVASGIREMGGIIMA